MKAITPFFLLSVLGLSACQAASRLAGTSWKLILYGDLINPQPVLLAESPTLKFQSNERFVAQTGCYSAGGNYEEAGNKVQFNDLLSTLMACADKERAAQEAAYVEGLK
jgi:heat shock protein HslJ